MILGIGQDIVSIERVSAVVAARPRFVQRILTPNEINAMPRAIKQRDAYISKRYAAKEACVKATGIGMRLGVSWHDMEISRSEYGAPILSLSGKLLVHVEARFRSIDGDVSPLERYCDTKQIPASNQRPANYRVLLSLSDEPPYAVACAILLRHPS